MGGLRLGPLSAIPPAPTGAAAQGGPRRVHAAARPYCRGLRPPFCSLLLVTTRKEFCQREGRLAGLGKAERQRRAMRVGLWSAAPSAAAPSSARVSPPRSGCGAARLPPLTHHRQWSRARDPTMDQTLPPSIQGKRNGRSLRYMQNTRVGVRETGESAGRPHGQGVDVAERVYAVAAAPSTARRRPGSRHSVEYGRCRTTRAS